MFYTEVISYIAVKNLRCTPPSLDPSVLNLWFLEYVINLLLVLPVINPV